MLRGDEIIGCGSSYGGDSQQSSRGWENEGPLWRNCYEYVVVTSRLKQIVAVQGHSDQNDDIDALWRKRGELAKGIVEAAAPTIHDLLLKTAMSTSFLSEDEVGVVLTLQYLEECDRALAQKGDGESNVSKLWSRSSGHCASASSTRLPRSRRDGIASSRARKSEVQTTLAPAFHSQGRGTS